MSYVDRIFLVRLSEGTSIEFVVIEELTEDMDEGPIYLCVSEENKTFNMSENDLDTLLIQGKIQEIAANA